MQEDSMKKNSEMFVKQYALLLILISVLLLASLGGCFAMLNDKDTISELSFSHDGKKVVFDRCREGECKIQVYDLETGELAAYQSPKNEQWTMGKYSYDGKRLTFSVFPIKPKGGLDLGNMQIAVMDADGKNLKKVTTGPGAKLYPTFSHNGKKILYACAAYIREKGKTPAAQYDAWEVNLDTGEQTQLTFFKYFYMGYLSYFPDDERYIYYGELPEVFEGVKSYQNETAFKQKMIELGQKGMGIHAVVVMKGKEMIPKIYNFGDKVVPEKPLLSQDGSVLIFEKAASAGKFYLYSPDGNHRLVHHAGSTQSVALSLDGELLGICRDDSIFAMRVSDDAYYRGIFLRRFKDWDDKVLKMPYLRLLPEKPFRILNK
jgi:tricorn protease-like protein